jgi:hypothetical protein
MATIWGNQVAAIFSLSQARLGVVPDALGLAPLLLKLLDLVVEALDINLALARLMASLLAGLSSRAS